MARKTELEADLEDRCVARIEALGGMALKLRPPTGRGFPDRTCLLPGKLKSNDADRRDWANSYERPRVFFIEFKRQKTGAVSTQQHKWRVLLTQLGFGVYTVDNDADFEAALERELVR